MEEESILTIHTDGSSYSNPRKGGIGIVYVTIDADGNEVIETSELPGYKSGTNNEMELFAALTALTQTLKRNDLERFNKVILFTDSMYVVEGQKSAIFYWSKNGWRNKEGRPISHAGHWKDLIKCINKLWNAGLRTEFKWEKGHKHSKHNKTADRLAKQSAKNPLNDPLNLQSVRRKRLPGITEPGIVKLVGQRLQVAILSTEPLKINRGYKHRYQVLSKKSPFYKKIDFIYTDTCIVADGHCYNVRLNGNGAYPKIVKVYSEFDFKTRKLKKDAVSDSKEPQNGEQ